ncbi:MAG: type II toxin-antitoxin system Phd/YefM family antitoxin [Spirochaetales bacterium]|nr:type II toxin-antitoxin system Phd/YefM family antitoxin [Spirochaetales bacterium]
MSSINITNARKQLYKLVEEVQESHKPVIITSKTGSAVLLSEEDWRAVEETLYLSSIPGMRESIKEGLAESLSKSSKKLDW